VHGDDVLADAGLDQIGDLVSHMSFFLQGIEQSYRRLERVDHLHSVVILLMAHVF
jgi:hypothetical protein